MQEVLVCKEQPPYLKGRYSGRASFTHMINMVSVKCGKTLFFNFLPPWCPKFNFRTQLLASFKYNPVPQQFTLSGHPWYSKCTTRDLTWHGNIGRAKREFVPKICPEMSEKWKSNENVPPKSKERYGNEKNGEVSCPTCQHWQIAKFCIDIHAKSSEWQWKEMMMQNKQTRWCFVCIVGWIFVSIQLCITVNLGDHYIVFE